MLLPPLIRIPILLNQGLPFNPKDVPSGPISKYYHTIGREPQHMNFGRDIVQSITTTGLGMIVEKQRVPNLSLKGGLHI